MLLLDVCYVFFFQANYPHDNMYIMYIKNARNSHHYHQQKQSINFSTTPIKYNNYTKRNSHDSDLITPQKSNIDIKNCHF